MQRARLTIVAMGATAALLSCSSGGRVSGNDASPDACTSGVAASTCSGNGGTGGSGGNGGNGGTDSCPGTVIPASCYQACDQTSRTPDGRPCADGQEYRPAFCLAIGEHLDPLSPTTHTCGPDGGTTCTDLANDAPPSPVRFHSGSAPADALGAGGVIVDGIYNLISTDVYGSSDSKPENTAVGTIRISKNGTQMESVGFPRDSTVSILAVSGTQVAETPTCWRGALPMGPTTEGYTATPETLMLSNSSASEVFRYSLR